VFGDDVFTEDWDWDELALVFDQLAQAHDLNIDSVAKAHARGGPCSGPQRSTQKPVTSSSP
jgi:hypothetical protein